MNETNNDKIKEVIVKTPNGDITLHYKHGKNFDINSVGVKTLCETDCPYNVIGSLIPDPEDPTKTYSNFCNFCTRKGDLFKDEEDSEIRYMHPVEGSLEKNLGVNVIRFIPGVDFSKENEDLTREAISSFWKYIESVKNLVSWCNNHKH